MKLAERFYNSADGKCKEPVIIQDIIFAYKGEEYNIIEMTSTEVCILVPVEYHSRGPLLLACWRSKDKGQVIDRKKKEKE